MRIGGLIASCCFMIYGVACTEFWHLALVHSITGVGVGLLVPGIGPTLQKYNSAAHPKRLAQASALPMFGLQAGMIAGPMIQGAIVGDATDRDRMNIAWLFCGSCMLIGFLLFESAFGRIMNHAAFKSTKLTPKQVEIAMKTDAQPQEEFIDEMCALLRAMLTEGNEQYRGFRAWHGVAQQLISKVLDESFPFLPKQTPEDGSQAYYEALAAWVAKNGTEEHHAFWRERLPHIPLPGVDIDNAHGMLMGAFGAMDVHGGNVDVAQAGRTYTRTVSHSTTRRARGDSTESRPRADSVESQAQAV
eukprot:CAMPEP_0204429490 /NCGR_PEP_ID=MMETSP0470-20130426/60405_1 /ASSEMBLY_ACC=CAM_ASM_000385 /TAXON_ID=2969 /ORGANISM="Oxyrrhis marina" /LENGTH=302 /DNA_ID=CAMNT_0051427519 /DNA_START=25 /DNA_END=930 /DNA_ORIENTATION=+